MSALARSEVHRSRHRGGMKSDNPSVAGEVRSIQCNDMRDSLSLHERNQTGIVDLNTLDPMSHDKSSPKSVGGGCLCQDREESLQETDPSLRLRNREPVAPACGGRSCANVPEFCNILGRRYWNVPPTPKPSEGVADVRVVRVGPVEKP